MREIISLNGMSTQSVGFFPLSPGVARFSLLRISHLASPHVVMFGPETLRPRLGTWNFVVFSTSYADHHHVQSARPVARLPTRAGRYALPLTPPSLPTDTPRRAWATRPDAALGILMMLTIHSSTASSTASRYVLDNALLPPPRVHVLTAPSARWLPHRGAQGR